eukprot:Polyplicarium_translucidae@DN3350_c0_g1_i1.p2
MNRNVCVCACDTRMAHPPAEIAHTFVTLYFTSQKRAPDDLHRFYSSDAKVTRSSLAPDDCRRAEGLDAIRGLLNDEAKLWGRTKISSIEEQGGVRGSVLVQIVGTIDMLDRRERKFVQSVVLERGIAAIEGETVYFVLNDVLTFLDDESLPSPASDAAVGKKDARSAVAKHGNSPADSGKSESRSATTANSCVASCLSFSEPDAPHVPEARGDKRDFYVCGEPGPEARRHQPRGPERAMGEQLGMRQRMESSPENKKGFTGVRPVRANRPLAMRPKEAAAAAGLAPYAIDSYAGRLVAKALESAGTPVSPEGGTQPVERPVAAAKRPMPLADVPFEQRLARTLWVSRLPDPSDERTKREIAQQLRGRSDGRVVHIERVPQGEGFAFIELDAPACAEVLLQTGLRLCAEEIFVARPKNPPLFLHGSRRETPGSGRRARGGARNRRWVPDGRERPEKATGDWGPTAQQRVQAEE